MASAEEVSARLHDWALREMHFRPQGRHVNTPLPTQDDFKLICRGQMMSVWRYITEHVHSKQTVRKVHGNVSLKTHQLSSGYKVKYGADTTYSAERAALMERKRQLTAALVSSSTAISHLEKEVERLRADICNTERMYTSSHDRIKDGRRKSMLLTAFSWQINEEVAKYNELQGTLRMKSEAHKNRTKMLEVEPQYYSTHHQSGSDKGQGQGHDESQALETACTHDVREACSAFNTFLHQLLQGEYSDKTLLETRKEMLWQKIEAVLDRYPAQHILSSLATTTHDSALDLQKKTGSINIKSDVEKLKLKYEREQLMDTATEPSTLQTVHQLLLEMNYAHVHQFMETERCRNSSFKLGERRVQARDMMMNLLAKHYSTDQGALNLAKSLYDSQVQLAANRAAVRTLEDVSEKLKDEISISARQKEALYAKYQKIQNFRTLTESKQNLIRVLVRHNASARTQLEQLQSEIVKYIQSSLSNHEREIASLTVNLRDGVTKEVEAFAKLALPYLMYTVLESACRIAVIDLSINRLQDQPNSQSQILQKVLAALDFPYYKASERLLPAVLELKNEMQQLEDALNQHDMIARSLECHESEHKSLVRHIGNLCSQVRARDKEQMDTVLPVLQKRLTQATHALTDCLNLRDTSQYWWEQPGQATVPWVKVDDMTLQQWKNKWTVAVTRLRQHQLQS